MSGRPGARSGPSYSRSQTGRSLAPRRAMALAESIDEPPPTGDDDGLRRARRRAAPRCRVGSMDAPGLGSTSAKTPASRPAVVEDAEDAIDDAGTLRRPGRVTTKTRRPADRGDHLGECLDRPDAEQHAVAQRHLEVERSGERWRHQRTSSTVSVVVSRRTVSQRRQPNAWNQRSVVDAVRVLEDPDLVEVALVGVRDRSRGRPAARRRTTNSSSGRRPQRGTVEPVHQRVPAEPWSARTWSAPEPRSARTAR